LIASSTFGNRPIAVKVSAVSNPCPAAVEVGLGSTRAEPVVMRTAGIGATSPFARVPAKDGNPPGAALEGRKSWYALPFTLEQNSAHRRVG
jgi:hypothetical protein